MAKALGDEIMILEGLGSSSLAATKGDLLAAVADFPINTKEQILSGLNESEDNLDDIISLSHLAELGGFGRAPRRHPRPRPRPRRGGIYPYPVPYYPDYSVEPSIVVVENEDETDDSSDEAMEGLGRVPRHHHRPHGGYRSYPYYFPTSVEPSVLVVEKEAEEDSDDLEAVYRTINTRIPKRKKRKSKGAVSSHIRRLELKMKDLHPGKVKLTPQGVEGLGTLAPSKKSLVASTKAIYQIALIQRAAANPNSNEAKVIVKNLDKKAKELEALSKNRLQLASDSVAEYRKDKSFVDKLERVARSKALVVVNAAAERQSGRAIERKMDKEIKDVRRLHDRSVGIGRRAVHNMKIYSFSSMLSKNADAQAMVTRAAKLAVMNGKPEEAKILALAINKHSEIARAIKGTRQKQTELWKNESDKLKFDRLAGRRERFLKAIAMLTAKSQQGPLSEEDQRALRDAYAQIYRIEAAMIGLQGGVRVIPQGIEPKQYTTAAVTLGDFQQEPQFSVEVNPNDPSGAFLEGIGMIFDTKFSVGPKEYDVNAAIGAIFEPSFTIGAKVLPVEASLEAMFEPSFTVRPKRLNVAASFGAMREAKFTEQMVQPPVEASFEALKEPQFSVDASPPPDGRLIGRWLENFALGWFSDAGDLVDDTATSLPDLLKGLKGWDDPIDCEGCSINGLEAGPAALLKKYAAEKAAAKQLDPGEAEALSRLAAAVHKAGSCKSVKITQNPPHSKNAYLQEGYVGKWIIGKTKGHRRLDPVFLKSRPIWCKVNPKGVKDIAMTSYKTKKGEWRTQGYYVSIRHKKSFWQKLGKTLLSPVKAVGKAVSTVVKSTVKAVGKVASGAVNIVKTVASTTFNTLKEVATGDLKGAANALYKGGKGVAGEVYRQAKGVYNYAKSQFNAVCGLVSDSAVKTIGAAAAGAVTGGAGAVPASMAIQYGSKICGAASGVEKMAGALVHGDFKGAAKALAKTTKGLVNVKDMVSAAAGAVGVPIPPAAMAALGNAKSIAEAGKVLSKVASGKNVAKILTQTVKSNVGDLVKLPPEVKDALGKAGSAKDVVKAMQETKAASALALLGKAPTSPYYNLILGKVGLTKTERQAATTAAIAEAKKNMGLSGDIYDIAEAMDQRNLMARKIETIMSRMPIEKRKRLMARKRLAAMAHKMREDQWEQRRKSGLMPWDGLPERWVTYKPLRYVTSSVGEVPYVEPPYRKFDPYRRIAVTKGFGQLPGNFPQVYERIAVSKKHGLGEVKYIEPKYRKFNVVRPRSYITSSVESYFSGLEAASLAAPVLLT